MDAETEKRIQREIDLGHYREPVEVITHALNRLEAERDWFLRNKEAISEHLDESYAQAQRGETYSPEEARAELAARRAKSAQ